MPSPFDAEVEALRQRAEAAERERYEALAAAGQVPHGSCVIWSLEHQAWWRPHRMGYTERLGDAGVYSRKEADTIVAQANLVYFNECAIPLACFQWEALAEGAWDV